MVVLFSFSCNNYLDVTFSSFSYLINQYLSVRVFDFNNVNKDGTVRFVLGSVIKTFGFLQRVCKPLAKENSLESVLIW